jgi:anti-sigma factor ChrR (cupin superfamily)
MTCTRLQELAAAYALGALDRPEAMRLEALMAADPDLRSEVDTFVAVAQALGCQTSPAPPPAGVRSRVLERIRSTPQLGRTPASLSPAPAPADGFRFLRPADGEWSAGLHPGMRFQVLASSIRRNYMMLYIELDPGARIPSHDHRGDEELYVVSGDLVTEGRHLKAGDFVHATAGSHHQDLVSPGGCQAILLTPLTSALAEAAKRAVKQASQAVKSSLGL